MKSVILVIMLFISSKLTKAQVDFKINKFLEGTKITSICSDSKYLWAATDGNGIYRYSYSNKKWFNYSTRKNNIALDFFYSVAAGKRFVWAGSTDGLFIFNKRRRRWTKRKFGKGGQLSNWIRSLAYDKYAKVLWIGRFKYLTKFDLRRRRFKDYDLTINNNEKTNTIKTILVDGDSLVWFGTEAGLHKYNKNKNLDDKSAFTFYNNSRNYFGNEGDVVSVSTLIAEQHNIWIGLDEFTTKKNPTYNLGGFYKFDRQNSWTRFDKESGLPGNGIFCAAITGSYIWVSTYQFDIKKKETNGTGIVLINRLTGKVKTLIDNRIPNNVYAMYFDGKYLWLGSRSGIVQIDFENNFKPSFDSAK